MKYVKYCNNIDCKNRMEITFNGIDNIKKIDVTIICKNCKKENIWGINN